MFEVVAFYVSGHFARRAFFATVAAAETAASIYRQDGLVARVRLPR